MTSEVNDSVNNTTESNQGTSDSSIAPENLESMIKVLDGQLTDAKKLLTAIQGGMRVVRKQSYVLQKLAAKGSKTRRKRASSDTNTKSSGFAAASVLSRELKEFMNLPMDEMKSRTEVTKWLCQYVTEHKLQGSEDKRYICFDGDHGQALKKLLRSDKDTITYFELQAHLKLHISSKNNPINEDNCNTDTAATGTSATDTAATDTAATDTVATDAAATDAVATDAAATDAAATEKIKVDGASAGLADAKPTRRIPIRPRPAQAINQ